MEDIGSSQKESQDEKPVTYPLPLESYPLAKEGILKCYQDNSVESFVNYVPKQNDISLTRWYIDHIDPEFVSREFVCKEIIKLHADGSTTEISQMELVSLKMMGYTRWNEVCTCFNKYLATNPDIINSFSVVKKYLLRELGVLH
ncbi:MAG TPA: hypothetical protein PKD85_21900, partial [Saprospiraceae bacterium]|nr:hypothetical protein [Saprospiraceae bacterium]